MTIENYIIYLALMTILGFCVAYLYGRRTTQYKIHKYLFIIIIPILGLLGLVQFFGVKIIYFYLLSCILGFLLEGLFGWVYHKTLGERFWKYFRFTVGGHTSFLTPPLWGLAGVTFYLLSYFIGL